MAKRKIKSIPCIHNRLQSLWSICVRARAGYKCEYSGVAKGEPNANGKPTKIDAHHLLSKKIKDCPLKYEINNGIALSSEYHKFNSECFHKSPVSTITWLMNNMPERYKCIIDNAHIRVDLDNRKVLEEIEKRLRNNESLDFNKLKEIEAQSRS